MWFTGAAESAQSAAQARASPEQGFCGAGFCGVGMGCGCTVTCLFAVRGSMTPLSLWVRFCLLHLAVLLLPGPVLVVEVIV